VTTRRQLIVMAKAPVPGFAKTRLIPALGAPGAAKLAARLLEHTLQQAREARFDVLTLACAPDTAQAAFAVQARQGGIALVAQGEGDLGARMRRQFERAFDSGAEVVIVIGTDAPALDAALLDCAADALAESDAVFVPAADGGYALIGLRRLLPGLFDAMPWSTDAVMAMTRQRLAQAAWRHIELPLVHDIDEPADLVHLPAPFRAGL
jgi:rSAM/selenodomain-associated transferase 1